MFNLDNPYGHQNLITVEQCWRPKAPDSKPKSSNMVLNIRGLRLGLGIPTVNSCGSSSCGNGCGGAGRGSGGGGGDGNWNGNGGGGSGGGCGRRAAGN